MGSPGPVWERDVCWLEYGDIFTDEAGNEVGFGVVIWAVYSFSWYILISFNTIMYFRIIIQNDLISLWDASL